jgi:phosphate starvation-inducible PhoH-like protein
MSRQPSTNRKSKAEKPVASQSNDPKSLLDRIHIDIKCKTENQKKFINLIKTKEIIIANGRPGTGKTYLSCAEALYLLKTEPKFKKIILIKSVTPLKGEEIGFLKGTQAEKIYPIFYSFISNFHKLIGKELTEKMIESGLIELLPLSYIKGQSIDNSIIIGDEVQNITIDNMHTVLTRQGFFSKLILIGDSRQRDIKNKKESSLDFLVKYFSHIDGIGSCEFTKDDIVRNPIIKLIEDTFDKLEDDGIYKPY